MALGTALLLTVFLALVNADGLPSGGTRSDQSEDHWGALISALIKDFVVTAQMAEERPHTCSPQSQSLEKCINNHSPIASHFCSSGNCAGQHKQESLPIVFSPLDALIDFAINSAVYKHTRVHGYEFPLEDLVDGNLHLSNGVAGDVRDAYRAGPVTLRHEAADDGGRALLVSFTGGLQKLHFRYNFVYKWPLFRNSSGVVQGSVSPVVVEGLLRLEQPCRVRLLWLSVEHLGALQISGTGFGPLNGYMYKLLQNRAVRILHRAVNEVVNDMKKQIYNELQSISCTVR